MQRTGPDSVTSWMVALLCSLISLLLYGVVRLSGVLFVASMGRFGVDRQRASFPYILCDSVQAILGPLVGYLSLRFGVMRVVTSGCFVASAGIGLCFLAEDIGTVTFLWGVVFGFGFGLISLLLPVIITQNFAEKRATAISIVYFGSYVGFSFLPPLTDFLIETYGLSGTFLILAGFMLHTVPLAMLLHNPNSVGGKASTEKNAGISIMDNREKVLKDGSAAFGQTKLQEITSYDSNHASAKRKVSSSSHGNTYLTYGGIPESDFTNQSPLKSGDPSTNLSCNKNEKSKDKIMTNGDLGKFPLKVANYAPEFELMPRRLSNGSTPTNVQTKCLQQIADRKGLQNELPLSTLGFSYANRNGTCLETKPKPRRMSEGSAPGNVQHMDVKSNSNSAHPVSSLGLSDATRNGNRFKFDLRPRRLSDCWTLSSVQAVCLQQMAERRISKAGHPFTSSDSVDAPKNGPRLEFETRPRRSSISTVDRVQTDRFQQVSDRKSSKTGHTFTSSDWVDAPKNGPRLEFEPRPRRSSNSSTPSRVQTDRFQQVSDRKSSISKYPIFAMGLLDATRNGPCLDDVSSERTLGVYKGETENYSRSPKETAFIHFVRCFCGWYKWSPSREKASGRECLPDISQSPAMALRIFLEPVFLLVLFAAAVYASTFIAFISVVVDFGLDTGLSSSEGTLVVTIFSVASNAGLLSFGWVTDCGYMRLTDFAALLFLLRTATLLAIPHAPGFAALAAVTAAQGFCESSLANLFPLVIAERYAEEVHGMAISCVLFLCGPMYLVTPLLIGLFRDTMGSYTYLFLLMAFLSLLCSALLLATPCLARCRCSRDERLLRKAPARERASHPC